jgi:hypothetical protein
MWRTDTNTHYLDGSYLKSVASTSTAGVSRLGFFIAKGISNGGGQTERLSILSDGKVGIGTDSPSHRLQLGTNTSTSTATPETISLGGTFSSSAGANAKLRLWTDGSNLMGLGVSSNQLDYVCSSNYSHVFYNNGSETWRITSAGILQSNGAETIQTSTGNLTLATAAGNGNIILSPNGTGKVGIGITSPAGNLDIKEGLLITTTGKSRATFFNFSGNYADILTDPIVIGTNETTARPIAINYYQNTPGIVISTAGNVGIGTTTPSYKLQVNGSFGATTKSFRIDHPSKPNYTLEYGSLESPYHGVRLTGRGKVVEGVCVVDLPPYLKDLIHDDENINIQLTNLKHGKTLYVGDIDLNNSQFTVKADRAKTVGDLEFFWTFTGVRKDVDHLVVEKPKEV